MPHVLMPVRPVLYHNVSSIDELFWLTLDRIEVHRPAKIIEVTSLDDSLWGTALDAAARRAVGFSVSSWKLLDHIVLTLTDLHLSWPKSHLCFEDKLLLKTRESRAELARRLQEGV